MSTLEIIKTLLNVMDCSSVTDEGIRKACIALIENEIGGGEGETCRRAGKDHA